MARGKGLTSGSFYRLPLFGWDVHPFWVTVALLVCLGARLALMIRSNLKKDLDQIRLFTRNQAVGLAAFFSSYLSTELGDRALRLLLPAWGVAPGSWQAGATLGWIGLTLLVQAGAIGAILVGIHRRLAAGPGQTVGAPHPTHS